MKKTSWNIPPSVIAQTEKAFLSGRHEVFVIWTAARDSNGDASDTLAVSRCIVPIQTPGATPGGVWVHIAGTELQRIQLDNFNRKERSVIQLHTHPSGDVTMSELDREWEVVRHIGALSIIVPFYGAHGLQLGKRANVYEREERDWRLLSHGEVQERLVQT